MLAALRPTVPVDAGERAIVVTDLVKDYPTPHGPKRVLDGISFRVGPGERMAVLGRNGAGKSTLISLLAGLQLPTAGHVHRGLAMSWPLALSGGFDGEMTGYDNLRFVARVYKVPFRPMFEYVDEFAELGRSIYEPVRHYSSGMRARLNLGISLALEFECLLIDEVLFVGDQRFQHKCHDEIFGRRADCGMILAIHGLEFVEEYCSKVLVLRDGRGRVFDDVKLGSQIYVTL